MWRLQSTFDNLPAVFIMRSSMPQSLSYVLIHIIFTTKDRIPMIDVQTRPDLYAFLAFTAREIGCECFAVGGVADHVHLAVRFSRVVTIAKLIEKLKTSSTRWFRQQSPLFSGFAWQRGYGAFSVGPTDLPALRQYIDNQEIHHASHPFQHEYRAFLRKYEIDFDERYVWD
jgi:putative transposase